MKKMLPLLLLLSGCAGQPGQQVAVELPLAPRTPACANRPTPDPIITAGATMWPNPPGVDEPFILIQREGEGRFADVFAGVSVEPEQGIGVVHRIPSKDFDAFVHQVAGGACLELRDALHPNKKLRALQELITDDLKYWDSRGLKINSVGAKHDGSGVMVGTLDVDKAQVELPKRYGTAIPIIVEKEGPASLMTK